MADGRIQTSISDDRLEARVSIALGDPLESGALLEALTQAGVVHGLDESAVSRLDQSLSNGAFSCDAELVASGSAAEPGEDGRLELAFEVGPRAGALREDGSMDFADRDLLKSVASDERLAVRHPPGAGEPGCSVDGKALPATAGNANTTAIGSGAREGSDGVIQAAREGVIEFQEGKLLDVVDQTLHSGDVDIRSGNLEIKGSLTVQGDITAGFCARAEKNLEVKGAVDGGSAHAGRDLRVVGGVIGGDAGITSAERSLLAHHTQGATLVAGELLEIQADAVSSQLFSQEVRLGGRLVGGELHCESTAEVREAGSPMGAPTLLAAADILDRPVSAARLALAQARLTRSAGRSSGAGDRGDRNRSKGGKAGRLKRSSAKERLKRMQELKKRQLQLLSDARIRVLQTLHEGVVVRFGTHELKIEDTSERVRLRFDSEANEITMEALES